MAVIISVGGHEDGVPDASHITSQPGGQGTRSFFGYVGRRPGRHADAIDISGRFGRRVLAGSTGTEHYN